MTHSPILSVVFLPWEKDLAAKLFSKASNENFLNFVVHLGNIRYGWYLINDRNGSHRQKISRVVEVARYTIFATFCTTNAKFASGQRANDTYNPS